MITKATLNDLTTLNELNKEVQELHHELYPTIFKPNSDADKSTFFANFLKKEHSEILIKYTEKEELAIGYVMYAEKIYPETEFTFQRKSIYIHHILVKTAFQGKGVGRELMQVVLETAKEKNVNCVELDYWSKNTEAKAFFEKHHFSTYNQKCWLEL